MRKLIAALLPILLLAMLFSGCAAKGVKVHPNQLNDFDGYAYDTLITAQAALEGARDKVAAYPAAKPVLNQAIAAFNLAEASYKTYHTTGGGDTSQLQQQLLAVVSAVAEVQKAFGAKL